MEKFFQAIFGKCERIDKKKREKQTRNKVKIKVNQYERDKKENM